MAPPKKISLTSSKKNVETKKWYRCYYPHQSRVSVSSVCRILFKALLLLLTTLLTLGEGQICTNKYINVYVALGSGLHEILTMIRTFPRGFQNNHSCKWISDNFLGMLTFLLFLENCLKSICMHGCSPIHKERSFFFLKVWDRFVP